MTRISASNIINPYIGPRPFERNPEDQKLFFGRGYESDEIYSLIFTHQVLLVYAQSGAGKTSIFNAEIIPLLEENGYEVLPMARVRGASNITDDSSLSKDDIRPREISNFYIFNTLQSMKPEIDVKSLLDKSLSGFLGEWFAVKSDERGNPKPQVLIFDQFEEIFNFFLDDRWHEHQVDFFKQVSWALENNPVLRVVFIIREDYVARLDPFREILPEKLRPRFRVERLSEATALTAIRGPLMIHDINFDLYEDEIRHIIDDLLMIRVESFGKGVKNTLEVKGNFVEPIQLQVVCRRWWSEKISQMNNKEDAQKSQRYSTNVDEALEEFYVDAISFTVNSQAAKIKNVRESGLREWCEEKLITSSDTRGTVYQGDQFTEELPNEVVAFLDKKYLIRPELRSGSVWYELTHDRLIKPIKNSNLKWKKQEGERKARRNKRIVIPSLAIVGAIIAILAFQHYSITPSVPLTLGQSPTYLSTNPETNRIYVSNTGNNSISVIDGISDPDQVVENIQLDQAPTYISVNPETNKIYATTSDNSAVSVIDGKTNEVEECCITLDGIPIDQAPIYASVNPETNKIYVAGYNSNYNVGSISIINGSSDEMVNKTQLDQRPNYVSVDPETNKIYVLSYNQGSGTGYIITINGNTDQVISESIIPFKGEPSKLYINPDTDKTYLTGYDSESYTGWLAVINSTTDEVIPQSLISLKGEPSNLYINPDKNTIYIAGYNHTLSSETGFLMVINTTSNNVISENLIPNSGFPLLYPNPKKDTIYLAIDTSDTLESNSMYYKVVNGSTNEVIGNITLDKHPDLVDYNVDTNTVYFLYDSHPNNYTLISINGTTNKVTKDNLLVNEGISDLVVNPKSNSIYLRIYEDDSDTYSLISINGTTNKVISENNITLGDSPDYDLYFDPNTNTIHYNEFDFGRHIGSHIVINGTTNKVTENIFPLGQEGSIIVSDPNYHKIFVLDDNHTSLTVINGTTNKVQSEYNTTLDHGLSLIVVDVNPRTNTVYLVACNSSGYNIPVQTCDDDSDTYSLISINGTTNKVISENNFTMNMEPVELSVNPESNKVFILGDDYSSSSYPVVVMNATNNEIISKNNFTADSYPFLNLATDTIYVPTSKTPYSLHPSLVTINGTSNKIIGNITLDQEPFGLVVNQSTNTVYVNQYDLDSQTNFIAVINGTTNEEMGNITGDLPSPQANIVMESAGNSLFINPQTGTIYVMGSESATGSLAFINGTTNKVIPGNITLGWKPSNLFVNQVTNKMYVLADNSTYDSLAYDFSDATDYLIVINGTTNKVIHNITLDDTQVSQTPGYISVNPETNKIYVAGFNSTYGIGRLNVVNGTTNKVIPQNIISIDQIPHYISIDPETNKIYVAGLNPEDSTYSLDVINGTTNKVIPGSDSKLDQRPKGLYIEPKSKTVYVAGGSDTFIDGGLLTAINGTTYEEIPGSDIPLDQNPSGVSGNPKTGKLYVLGSDSVSIIDIKTNTVVMDLTIDKNIIDLSVNPTTNTIYVSDFDSHMVYPIDGNESRLEQPVVGPQPTNIKVGREPYDISVDRISNKIYVPGSDSITIVNGHAINDTVNMNRVSLEKVTDVAVNPNTNMTYVLGSISTATSLAYPDTASSIVTIINSTTNEVIESISDGLPPLSSLESESGSIGKSLFINPQENIIYVKGATDEYSGDRSLGAIDGSTNKVLSQFKYQAPFDTLSINPNTGIIYVAGSESENDPAFLRAINGTTSEEIAQGTGDITLSNLTPAQLYVNPNTNTIYLSGHNYTSDTSSLIVMNGTTNKMISESLFRSAEFPNLYPNPKTNMIYLVSSFSDYESELIAFNGTTNKVMEHIELKKSPSDVSFDPMNNAIYVLSADYDEIPPSNYITAIDGTTNKIIKDFPLYGIADLRAIDVNPDTSMIYLLSSSSESMSAINGTQLLAER